MKKQKLYTILILFSSFLYGQTFEYKVSLIQLFSEKGLKDFDKMNAENRKFFINQNQYPKPSYYSLTISDDSSFLQYIPSIDNDQMKSDNEVKIAPLGFSESYRIKQSPLVIMKHENLNRNIYSTLPDLEIEWKNTGKDSIILGYKVSEAIGKDKKTNFNYKVWYAKELPSNLGIYNLNNDNGFVLGYTSILENPDENIQEIRIEVYPYKKVKLSGKKQKNINKKISLLKETKIYTTEEVDKLYEEHNKRNNEMSNSGVN